MNSFGALSFALDDEEDNTEALMTFSSSPTTGAPLHVSTVPQCSKKSIRVEHVSFQAQVICYTYQETIHHYWTEILPLVHGETAISHGQCKWHGFQFLPQQKLWEKSLIIKSLL